MVHPFQVVASFAQFVGGHHADSAEGVEAASKDDSPWSARES
jgi:hypothetical protein